MTNYAEEKWLLWIPFKESNYDCYLAEWLQDELFLNFIFFDRRTQVKQVQIQFSHQSVYYYRYADESYRIETMDVLIEKFGRDEWLKHRFYQIENSSLLREFLLKSGQKNCRQDISHFVIIGHNEFIDILAATAPFIQIFNQNEISK